ncbi:hypothetical protein [Agrobacterium tumefaciens]|uniref:Uncharacterized protein n=1 Tax=Agrobacterium tumefaciens TaxID=358 RepID=A0A176WYA1_AGRTU|nr:hypothetical protein [Agrobacterium tumefaciens]OAE37651.1 hypothetical protein A7J57_08720 [Agrobacterium tumefaciens]
MMGLVARNVDPNVIAVVQWDGDTNGGRVIVKPIKGAPNLSAGEISLLETRQIARMARVFAVADQAKQALTDDGFIELEDRPDCTLVKLNMLKLKRNAKESLPA